MDNNWKLDEKDVDLIDRYLDGTMPEVEKKAFEKKLEDDSEFRSEYEKIKTMVIGINEHEHSKMRNILKETDDKMESFSIPKISNKLNLFRWALPVAAAIGLLFIIYVLLPTKDSSRALLEKYNKPYPNLVFPTTRSKPSEGSSNIQKAFGYYDEGDYLNAYSDFISIENETYETSYYLYRGICAFEIGKHDEAMLDLDFVINADPNLAWPAMWYKSLIFLKMDSISSSRIILSQLASGTNPYQELANLLLEELTELPQE